MAEEICDVQCPRCADNAPAAVRASSCALPPTLARSTAEGSIEIAEVCRTKEVRSKKCEGEIEDGYFDNQRME